MIGNTIDHYEIVEKLGEGGMGVVYKARDTRLNRFVAIKLLRPEKAGANDRIQRFVHEARTASALNHPHIVTIHEISSHNGSPFIVMEYVPGKSLDHLIPRKGMRLSEVLKIGSQVAGALAAAAAAGVIHRDVKPGNVVITNQGQAKVLDFGLAKLLERAASSEQTTLSMVAAEVAEQALSREGAVLGTASYMSPEQAEGKPLDPRSDIFSFGAMLYEMTTGQRAFRGTTGMSTISAILRDEPKPLSQFVGGIPRDLEKIIVRCLRKDPERRFQTMADVRVALLELKEESESGQALERAAVSARGTSWRWVLGAVTVAVVTAGLWLIEPRGVPLPQQTMVPVTTYPGSEMYPSFSPDGNQVAFYWDGDNGANPGIYVKLLGDSNALRLTTGQDRYPAWAPDGKRIAFVRGEAIAPNAPLSSSGLPNDAIYTVSVLGGPERKLSGIAPTSQMSWSPDGHWLAISLKNESDRGILLLPVEGGEPRRISSPKPPAFDRSPAFAQDGRHLAYVGCVGDYSCDVYVQALGPGYALRGSPRQITWQPDAIAGLTWSRDGGSLIYGAASEASSILAYMWRVGADGRHAPQRLEIAGPMVYCPSVSLTANRLVFHKLLRDYDIWRYRSDDGMKPLLVSSLADYNPQFSPDGTKIAFSSSRSGEAIEVWVAQADGSKPVQMTRLLGRHQGTPRWSPDGRWIAFDSHGKDGHWDIYAIEAAGGPPRRITFEPSDENMPFWSHDGKWVYYRSDRTGAFEIWRIPFRGGSPEQVTTRGGFNAYESADGKSLYYTKEDSGPLFAKRLPGGEEHQLLPYIYLRSFFPEDDGIYYIGRRTDEGYYPLEFFQFSNSVSRVLAKIEGGVFVGLSVSPDRKTILFSKTIAFGADLMMIENFQ